MTRRPSPIGIANEQVSILAAYRMTGMDVPDYIVEARSPKVHCPFGELYHSDGGVAAAMRLYVENNHAWCFSCAYFYTPVRLVARAFDLNEYAAAELLLDRTGYRPPDPHSVWDDLVAQEPQPDRVLLGEALKTFCRRTAAEWSVRQYEPPTAAVLSRCLALLDQVHSAGDAHQWLEGCKAVMRQALEPPGNTNE